MVLNISNKSMRVAAAVRAELARRNLKGGDLVAPLGLNRNAVYARIRGEHPFNIRELDVIANLLDISMTTLMESADLELRDKAAA